MKLFGYSDSADVVDKDVAVKSVPTSAAVTGEINGVITGETKSVFAVGAVRQVGDAAGNTRRRDVVIQIRGVDELDCCYVTATRRGAFSTWNSKVSPSSSSSSSPASDVFEWANLSLRCSANSTFLQHASSSNTNGCYKSLLLTLFFCFRTVNLELFTSTYSLCRQTLNVQASTKVTLLPVCFHCLVTLRQRL